MHAGDSIGVWTYNKDVYTGRMPLQTWSLGDAEEIAMRTGEYLRAQKFENDSQIDQAMSAVGKVVKLSDIITVILISDGKSPIVGTPFDDEINKAYLQNLVEMKKNAKPVVTVLQGRGGKFLKRYTVTTLEWPIVVPDLPIALKGVATEAKTETVKQEVSKPAPAKAPPLILVGPQPPEFPTAATAAATKPAPQPVPAPAPAPAPVTTVQTEVVAPAAPAVVTTPAPTSISTPVPAPVPAPAPVATTPAPAAPATIAMTSAPAPASVPDTAPTATVTRQMSPESYVNPGHPSLPPPPAASQPPIAPEPAPAPAPVSVGAPAVATTMTPAPTASQPAPAVASSADTAPVAKEAAKPAATRAASPAAVAPAPGFFKSLLGDHQTLLLVGGISLVVLALGLVAMMFRRPAARVSLISQTMNNQR